eukprot:s482_g18.t1
MVALAAHTTFTTSVRTSCPPNFSGERFDASPRHRISVFAAGTSFVSVFAKRIVTMLGRPESVEPIMPLQEALDVMVPPDEALHLRIRSLCAIGQGRLVEEVPPDGLRCKTLVVTCVPAEKRKGKQAKTKAVLVVLLVERRLSIPKLKQVLANNGLKPEGLASPEEAERVVGCSMGIVPPVCIEPKPPMVLDSQLFQAGAGKLVLGAAHQELHLLMSGRELLLETEGSVADISMDTADAVEAEPSHFPLRAAEGNVVHVVALVAAVRRLSRQLLFADLLPAGMTRDGERSIWLSPDGSGKLVRLQLLLGRSLAERVGGEGLAQVIRRLRPQQLIYVAGRLQLEELGEQCGKHAPSAPHEVRKIREAQLNNGIVDMVAEQIRILEEVHVPSQESEGSARKVGVKKAEAKASEADQPTLPLSLPGSAVHLVVDDTSLRLLEGVLRERLSGSADVDPESNDEAITPLLPILGLDAEWQPNTSQGIALFQMAFRRSVFLLDMVVLQDSPALRPRVAEVIRSALEAEHLYKVGFGLEVDVQRLAAVMPEISTAQMLIDLRDVTRAAFPEERRPAPNLSGLVKEVFGLPLDKTCQVSDWQLRPLMQEQLDYAAQDAHICVRLFDSLCYNHATLATQALQPLLSDMARTWHKPDKGMSNGVEKRHMAA